MLITKLDDNTLSATEVDLGFNYSSAPDDWRGHVADALHLTERVTDGELHADNSGYVSTETLTIFFEIKR